MATYNFNDFRGIGYHATTYDFKSTVTKDDVNKALTITGCQEAGLGDSADFLLGKMINFETGRQYGAVQDAGYAEFDITHDATPSNEVQDGNFVAVGGDGKLIKSTTYKGGVAVAVDATNHKAVVMIGTPANR